MHFCARIFTVGVNDFLCPYWAGCPSHCVYWGIHCRPKWKFWPILKLFICQPQWHFWHIKKTFYVLTTVKVLASSKTVLSEKIIDILWSFHKNGENRNTEIQCNHTKYRREEIQWEIYFRQCGITPGSNICFRNDGQRTRLTAVNRRVSLRHLFVLCI